MTNAEFREFLEKRTTKFAVDVFKLLRKLPYDVSTKIISYQLGKAASSIGANYHEANRAESKDDFTHKVSISLKEATLIIKNSSRLDAVMLKNLSLSISGLVLSLASSSTRSSKSIHDSSRL